MTWNEFKLRVLQTIFSNEGTSLNVDDTNQEYVDAMPGKFNEAVHILTTRGKPLMRLMRVVGRDGAEETTVEDGDLIVPVPLPAEGTEVDVAAYVPSCGSLRTDCMQMIAGCDAEACKADTTTLRLWGREPFILEVRYERLPEKVTSSTEGGTVLDVPDEISVPAVLYVASEVYKEDDIQLSTQWRNQFEVELETLQSRRVQTQRTVKKTSRWW